MFNGRFTVPAGRFEIFGGAGFGTGDVFAGAALNLHNAMTLGVEWKLYFTDSDSDLDTGLDSNAGCLRSASTADPILSPFPIGARRDGSSGGEASFETREGRREVACVAGSVDP
jgi:hypothetical protein